jgi:ATP-dependent Zn protease
MNGHLSQRAAISRIKITGGGVTGLPMRIRNVAYHEAGHAVIGVAVGMPLARVTIRPRGNSLVDGKTMWRHGSRSPLLSQVIVDYAGFSAERRIDASVRWEEGVDDHDVLEDKILRGQWADSEEAVADAYRFMRKVKKASAALVTRHWKAIITVAEELLRKQTLTGKQVRELVRLSPSSHRAVDHRLRKNHESPRTVALDEI